MSFFRHHRLQVVGRVLLVVGAALGAAYGVESGRYGWAVLAGLGAAWAVAGLVRYTEKAARDLTRFLEALRYDDASQGFRSEGRGSLFRALAAAFEEVNETFRRLRAEREEQAQYLQTVVRHVGVALIAFRPGGEVVLANQAARRLLRIGRLRHLDRLAAVSPALAAALPRLRSGERALVRVERDGDALALLVHAAQFRLAGQAYTLVSLQDIGSELEEQEMAAWQQLTRVLTHEIANSVAPIASLAGTAQRLLPAADAAPDSPAADAREALATIERRSNGLMNFVESYRSLTRIPKPAFALFPVRELFDDVTTLLRASFEGASVKLECAVEPAGLELAADRDLVEQVLINLLLNALQALEEGGEGECRVRLAAAPSLSGRPAITVTDNGPGIPAEALERVFVPFYTTKASGSGIGLSLSRQVMRLHGGRLRVRSRPGETVFSLVF